MRSYQANVDLYHQRRLVILAAAPFARYKGTGDLNDAANFDCVTK